MVVLVSKSDRQVWENDVKQLKQRYQLNDMGNVKKILGMRVTRMNDRVYLDQSKYINNKLIEQGMSGCSSTSTPEVPGSEKGKDESDVMESATPYRAIVGMSMYLAVSTRPDIAHAANSISRKMQTPTHTNMHVAKRVLRYLSGTQNYGLMYEKRVSSNDIHVNAYCDSDYANSKEDRKSTTGYCVFINGNLISWATRKQPTVAQSSCEAELLALSDVVKEVEWVIMLLTELRQNVVTPATINIDNQSTIKISENDACHERTKHIDIRHFYVRDEIKNKKIKLKWVESSNQLADILTKSLSAGPFERLRDKLLTKVEDDTSNKITTTTTTTTHHHS
jgi:hypothetical protein